MEKVVMRKIPPVSKGLRTKTGGKGKDETK
jgi:hypothetical protein